MTKSVGLLSALGLTMGLGGIFPASATAGGLDRSLVNYAPLYESGRYVEFGLSQVRPSVKGEYGSTLGGGNTGNMSNSFTLPSFTYKADLSDNLSYLFALNTPHGASADYRAGAYKGLTAQWNSQQITMLLRYKMDQGFSVHGGLKYIITEPEYITVADGMMRGGFAAAASNPNLSPQQQAMAGQLANAPADSLNYRATAKRDGRLAGIIGAAYERPEIGLRIALTYEGSVTHKLASTESMPASQYDPTLAAIFAQDTTIITMPQSVALDVQTGIAQDTLLFGSLRWSEWSKWALRPPAYGAMVDENITDFQHNVLTWQLGIGHRINENASVFARVGYEKAHGGVMSRLAPYDGVKSLALGGSYKRGPATISAAVEYVKLGDAVDASGVEFSGSKAVGFGMTVGYRF